jgi:hypothetical protein
VLSLQTLWERSGGLGVEIVSKARLKNIFQINFGIGKMLVYVCTRFGKNGDKNERFSSQEQLK